MTDEFTPLPLDHAQPEAWMTDASCAEVDGDLFFPNKGETSDEAKRICASCPVARQCLERGINEPFGVWAGTTARQRRRMRRDAA